MAARMTRVLLDLIVGYGTGPVRGCTMQIAAALAAGGTPMPVRHVAEVLDASIRGRPPSALG